MNTNWLAVAQLMMTLLAQVMAVLSQGGLLKMGETSAVNLDATHIETMKHLISQNGG